LAQSRASFIAKISIVLEEIDESVFWLEFIEDENLVKSELLLPLIDEGNELKAIFYSSRKTARSNK
jgi:four helix bundle protein